MPFFPTDIAGCKLILRRDVGLWKDTAGTIPATLANDHIARWDDQSGNGSHMVQVSDGGQRPLLVVNALNGHSVPGFDGAGMRMTVASGGPTTVHTICIYGRLTSTPGGFCGFGYVSGTAASNQNSVLGATAANKLWEGGFGNVGLQGGTLTTNTWYTMVKKYDGTNVTGYLNGVSNIGPTATTLTSLAADMGLGQQTTSGSFCPCQLLGVIVYDSALSDANRNLVETFLANEAAAAATGNHNLMLMGCGN